MLFWSTSSNWIKLVRNFVSNHFLENSDFLSRLDYPPFSIPWHVNFHILNFHILGGKSNCYLFLLIDQMRYRQPKRVQRQIVVLKLSGANWSLGILCFKIQKTNKQTTQDNNFHMSEKMWNSVGANWSGESRGHFSRYHQHSLYHQTQRHQCQFSQFILSIIIIVQYQ